MMPQSIGRLCSAAALLGAIVMTPTAAGQHADPADRPAAEGELVRYTRGVAVPLDLDPTRLAVYLAGDRTGDAAAAALRPLGLDPAGVEPFGVPGWSLATTPAEVDTQAEVEQLVAQIAAAGAVQFVSPVFFDRIGEPMFPGRDLLVRFDGNVGRGAARGAIDAVRAGAPAPVAVDDDWAGMAGAYRVRGSAPTGFDVLAQANALAVRNDVRWAEPDWAVKVQLQGAVIPNDPSFPNCWGHNNTGENFNCGTCLDWTAAPGVIDMDMDTPEAWEIATGDDSIIVAIFDSGINQTHPDINQLTPGYDFVNPGGDGGPWQNCDTHGTAVAGAVSAIMNNNTGGVGVAPGCRSVSMKIFNQDDDDDPNCNGSGVQLSWIVSGLDTAENIGVRVTNHSYTTGGQSDALEDKFADTRSNGMVHFASAGNGGSDNVGDPSINHPANISTVNAVAALDPDGELTGFSNYGNGLFISAPGVGVCGTGSCFCGTSAASPSAAGVAALVLSIDPSLSAAQVETVLALSARDLGDGGYDTEFGWGFVNAYDAVLDTLDCPGGGSCYQSNGTPGCLNPDCCAIICLDDPFCCNVEWDGQCAQAALDTCLGCPGTGACDQANGTPGCNDGDCCELVCLEDSLCCDEEFGWDDICVSLAFQLCGFPTPENDDCDDAQVITNGTWQFDVSNVSNDGVGHGECGWNAEFIKDVWYEYTATCTGWLTVSTCGMASFDTWIAVYSGDGACPPTSFDLLACENDTPGCANNTARIDNVFVEQGETYLIRIGALNVDDGTGSFTVSCSPLFDDCSDAFFLDDFTGSINIDTNGASTDGLPHVTCTNAGDDQIHADVWYTWIAPCTGTLILDMCNTANFDTKIAVYSNCTCPATNPELLGCNDDVFGCPGHTSYLEVPVEEGQCYTFRVGGFNGDQGTGQLNIACQPAPTNDFCEDAALTLLGIPTPFTNEASTTDGMHHAECGTQILNDVWFTRTATCTGFMTVSTCGLADFDTMIAVYDGCECPGTDENLLGCNDQGAFNCDDDGAQVTVPVIEGECYLVRVGSPPVPVLLGNPGYTGSGAVAFTCVETCLGDVDLDGDVDVSDLLDLLAAWGECPVPCGPACLADLDGDCSVDTSDLLDLLANWGTCFPS